MHGSSLCEYRLLITVCILSMLWLFHVGCMWVDLNLSSQLFNAVLVLNCAEFSAVT